jgi:hypothetical protein
MKQVITLAISFCLILSTLSLHTLRSSKIIKEYINIPFSHFGKFALLEPITNKVLEELQVHSGHLSLKTGDDKTLLEALLRTTPNEQNFHHVNNEHNRLMYGFDEQNKSIYLVLMFGDIQYIFKVNDEVRQEALKNVEVHPDENTEAKLIKHINSITPAAIGEYDENLKQLGNVYSQFMKEKHNEGNEKFLNLEEYTEYNTTYQTNTAIIKKKKETALKKVNDQYGLFWLWKLKRLADSEQPESLK